MANRLLSRLLIIAACICAWAELAWAERKVAIVIGNSSYEHSQVLKNPANDAKAVSDLFKQLGYEVKLHLDIDRSGFTQALGDFHQVATNADAAIFYYAGHGVSVDGRNYLIPVDSDIQRVTDVKLGAAIDAELAIEQALADAKVKIVFLDACRDNPFIEQIKRSLDATRSSAVSSGLAEMKSGAGTLIAFSTAPGQVAMDGEGDKSPFAEALLTHLSEPGLEIRLAMTKVRADVEVSTDGKQTPWESTNLTGFYYINPSVKNLPISLGSSEPAEIQTARPSEAEIEAETEYWRSVRGSGDAAMIASYMALYPKGMFLALAEALLKKVIQAEQQATNKSTEKQVSTEAKPSESALAEKTAELPTVPSPTAEGRRDNTDRNSKSALTSAINVNGSKSNVSKKSPEPAMKKSSAQDTTKKHTTNRSPPQSSPTARSVATLSDKKPASNLGDHGDYVDQAMFLSQTVRVHGHKGWKYPSGASGRDGNIIYKGRKYTCRPTAGGTGNWVGPGKVICYAKK